MPYILVVFVYPFEKKKWTMLIRTQVQNSQIRQRYVYFTWYSKGLNIFLSQVN